LKTVVFCSPAEVVERLTQLGVSAEMLREAVKKGQFARDNCTEDDPPATPGIYAWGRTTRGLREILRPLGWRRCDAGNYSRTINDGAGIAIAVSAGDDATGRPAVNPKTRYRKGPLTAAVVARNIAQLELFDNHSPPPPHDELSQEPITWFLLIAATESEVRCELSLPSAIGFDGRIEKWKERIILEPVQLDPEPMETTDAGPEIVVEVTRR
jgi:hypothetical protein